MPMTRPRTVCCGDMIVGVTVLGIPSSIVTPVSVCCDSMGIGARGVGLSKPCIAMLPSSSTIRFELRVLRYMSNVGATSRNIAKLLPESRKPVRARVQRTQDLSLIAPWRIALCKTAALDILDDSCVAGAIESIKFPQCIGRAEASQL